MGGGCGEKCLIQMGTPVRRMQNRCPNGSGEDEWAAAQVRAGSCKVLWDPKRWRNCIRM